jgi:uncharacterized membrane protein (UPF0182 family)
VSDGRNVTMAQTLRAAMAALELPMGGQPPPDRPVPGQTATPVRWPRQALDMLEAAQARLRAGDWAGYGRAMDELRALLERIQRQEAGGRVP